MANVQMDYKDFPLKQCGFSLLDDRFGRDAGATHHPYAAIGDPHQRLE